MEGSSMVSYKCGICKKTVDLNVESIDRCSSESIILQCIDMLRKYKASRIIVSNGQINKQVLVGTS